MTEASQAAGANRPALTSLDQLSKDHGNLEEAVALAIAAAAAAPPVVEDEEDIEIYRAAVKDLKNATKSAEAKRVDTKAPYLDAERVVDSYFNKLKEICDDHVATLSARAKLYLDKKAAAEEARRQEEARIAREAEARVREQAREAEREAQRKAQEARDKAAEAERLRKAEAERQQQAIAADQIKADEAQRAAAQQAIERAEQEARDAETDATRQELDARTARQQESAATATTIQAEASANAKPADMARTRVAGGGMATLEQIWTFKIEAFANIDLEALRPYFTEAAMEAAIRKYVAVWKDKKPLMGVSIFPDTNTQWR